MRVLFDRVMRSGVQCTLQAAVHQRTVESLTESLRTNAEEQYLASPADARRDEEALAASQGTE